MITAQTSRFEPLTKGNPAKQEKRRKLLSRLWEFFATKSKVKNDQVEKLLHISDATATRYLETLEKEGKIKQVGKTGQHTHYEKI